MDPFVRPPEPEPGGTFGVPSTSKMHASPYIMPVDTSGASQWQPAARQSNKRRCDDNAADEDSRSLERVSSHPKVDRLGEERVDMSLQAFVMLHPSLQESPCSTYSMTQIPSPMGSPELPASFGTTLPPVRLPPIAPPIGHAADSVTWRAWLASLLQSSSRD